MEQFLCWIVRDGWQIKMFAYAVECRENFAIEITKGDTTYGRCCASEPEDVRMLISKMESFANQHCATPAGR